ncbi:unnamed protein product [Alopecurus aequalis]
MHGLCFNCYKGGHRKRYCKGLLVCIRFGEEGHESHGCSCPRSPDSEEELRHQVLAKVARRVSPGPSRALPHPPAAQLQPARPVAQVAAPAVVESIEAPLCVVRRSRAISDLERRLKFAMVVHVGGAHPWVSCSQVQEALEQKVGLPRGGFSVHLFYPEDFLVVPVMEEMKRAAAAVQPSLDYGGFSLFFKPWNKQAKAIMEHWSSKVDLVLEGVLPHAWDREVIEELLGDSCVVEEVDPGTALWENLATFRVSAWSKDVQRIPPARTLAIPEPDEGEEDTPSPARENSFASHDTPLGKEKTEVQLLKYRVLIHVDRVEEAEDPMERLYAHVPPSPGSGQSGLPDDRDD